MVLDEQTVEQVCPSRMRGMPTVETLGVSTGRPNGQRPWKSLSTGSEGVMFQRTEATGSANARRACGRRGHSENLQDRAAATFSAPEPVLPPKLYIVQQTVHDVPVAQAGSETA